MKKISFLPTKFKYNNYSKNIIMYYRDGKTTRLNKTEIPFDYYIYISPSYRTYGNTDSEEYRLLTTNEKLIKIYINPRDAYDLYNGRLTTGEADVSPEQRFICDSFADVEFPNDIKPRIYLLDIETYVLDGKFPSFQNNNSEINAITIFDTYTSQFYSWILIPDNWDKSNIETTQLIKEATSDYGDVELKLFKDPKTLLNSFMQFISTEVPDIITAWNSKFDIPYIVRKIYDYFDFDGLKMISPFKTVSSKVKKALYDGIDLDMDTLIPGIDVIDMLSLYKKNCETQKPSYSLKAITTEELGETKIVSENEEVNDVASMYDNDFITFCKYNIQDVRLMVLLENKVKFIDLALAIRNIVKTDYQDIFFETRTIDNMFVMEAVRRRNSGNWNYILPSKPKHINKTKFLGAYVKSPQTGLFKWIADLDFKSLYPSIVKTFKLSNETIVCDIDPKLTQLIVLYSLAKSLNINDLNYVANEILPKYLTPSKDIIEITENKSTLNKNKDISTFGEDLVLKPVYSILYHDMNHPNVFNGINEFSKWLKENNYVFMPNGVVIDQNKSDAIIADVIADIMTSREKYKKKMLQALADKKEDEAEVLDMAQRAFKVLNNSCFTPDTEVITETGIKNIKDVVIGDKIWNFNVETKQMELDEIVDTIVKEHDDLIYNIKSTVGNVDFSVTGDHKFVVEDRNHNIYYKTAEELYNIYQNSPTDRHVYYYIPEKKADEKKCDNYKITLTEFVKSNYDNVLVYIRPIDTKTDLRTLYANTLKDVIDRDKLGVYKGDKYKRYFINIKDLTKEQLDFLEVNDKIKFNCYFKLFNEGQYINTSITPMSYYLYDIAEFMGWLLSEGDMYTSKKKTYSNGNIRGITKRISISQYKSVNPIFYEEIKKNITKLGFKTSHNKKNISFCNTIFYDWLKYITVNKTTVPNFIINNCTNIKEIFTKSIYKGDGDRRTDNNDNVKRYTIKNSILKDQLVNIWTSLGYNIRITFSNIDKCYRINLYKKRIALYKKYFSTKSYHDKVYCVTAKSNHNIMAGRNGKFSLVGQCYGVTANERFRLYDLRLAESITTAGQVIIRSSTYIMNEYANNLAGTMNKDYVITNDTDSIIFTLDGIINNSILPTERDPKILADIANYSKLCQEHVNESIYNIIKNVFYKYKVTKTNNFLMIKNEWLANAGLFVAKKNYVINMVFKEGVPYEKMKSTGISLRRSSTPKVLKPFLENVLGKILSFADNNEVNQLIVEECRKIKEDYSIRDIALPISVNDMDSYENLPVHIRGAKIWNDYYTPSDLNKITVGKVKYIYVKSWDKQELNLNKEYVISIPDTDRDWNYISDKIIVDYNKMKERLIIKPVSIFYNALNWDIPTEVKTNNNGAFINMGTKISSKFKLI